MSAPLTVTIVSQEARDRMIAALRELADKLQSGELQYAGGGIIVENNMASGGDGRIVVNSDLVLVRGAASHG